MKMLGKSSLSSVLKVVLDVAWVVGIVIAVLVTVAVPLGSWGLSKLPDEAAATSTMSIGDVSFRLNPDVAPLETVDGATAYVSKGVGTIAIEGFFDLSMVVTALMGVAALMFLGLFIVWQLRRVLRTFAQGAPFAADNVSRLRKIGFGMLGLSIGSELLGSVLTYQVSQRFDSEAIEFVNNFAIDWSSLFSAAIVFVLAEIFRLGAELQEEQALTV